MMVDISAIREDFPILKEKIHGKPLVYLDNAATTQKPRQVLEASRHYYEHDNANIHRGVHTLSQRATVLHEEARETLASFLGASEAKEVLFTSGCTESLNMVSQVLEFSHRLQQGDEIIISTTEHHSNIVPWQMLCERTGAVLKVIPLTTELTWDCEAYKTLLSPKTRVVSLGQISNGLGLVNPVKECIKWAKIYNSEILTIVDGAQSIPHLPVDVQELGCDFLAFSGHKLYAPTGTGILWGKASVLESLAPWKGGGEMIKQVTFEKTTYNVLPFKYEAGTPNIEGDIALAEAVRFVQRIGMQTMADYEQKLVDQCLSGLSSIDGIEILGGVQPKRGSVISFNVDGVHHYDVGVLLDQMGVAVRTGHHCCQPLMQACGITGTVRVSFAIYNTVEEVDYFLQSLKKALSMLR